MYTGTDSMGSLGRIEGELVDIRKLSERVSRLEHWHVAQRRLGHPGRGPRLPCPSIWQVIEGGRVFGYRPSRRLEGKRPRPNQIPWRNQSNASTTGSTR